MRFAVDSWSPEYGVPVEAGGLEPSDAEVVLDAEVVTGAWAPRRPGGDCAGRVLVVDGVRRVDARLWITGADGRTHGGLAASVAAGVACCDDTARVLDVAVERSAFSAAPELAAIATSAGTYAPRTTPDRPEALMSAVQQAMRALEGAVAARAGAADLLVVDGPLSDVVLGRASVGYVKTHHRSYLPDALERVVGELAAGERTPLFSVAAPAGRSRWSWYARLPGGAGHPWAGIVRGEAAGHLPLAEAVRLADLATCTLPRFASSAHSDARAPQNLYPIAGLERALRHRLADPRLVERALRSAAALGRG